MTTEIKDMLEIMTFCTFPQNDLSLEWRTDGEYAPITFWLNCNDVFFWGCADSEELGVDDLPALKQAIDDCNKVASRYGDIYGTMLFISRKREVRPQGACYPSEEAFWPLFDACGDEREVGLGNPRKPGEKDD